METTHQAYKYERLVRLPEVLHTLGISKSTFYAGMQNGQFPRPRKIGRSSVWPESQIKGIVAATLSESR
ncbi:helix-turn-helix transcriptional regulator [Oleidesulfovibrio sp.]|jgi:predicted DNA-binding transcriptional regulator AlpA|uniref:helix-turn-helix transcriptional regulator n=1 Tax=Oleidesulfovibrio sp. TaxID=2909707 RepID=UPI003A878F12